MASQTFFFFALPPPAIRTRGSDCRSVTDRDTAQAGKVYPSGIAHITAYLVVEDSWHSSLSTAIFINAAPGPTLSRPHAGDDPGGFSLPPCLAPRGFRSILFWKASLNKGLCCLHGGEGTEPRCALTQRESARAKRRQSPGVFWIGSTATTMRGTAGSPRA